MADSLDPSRPLDENWERILQAIVDGTYREFLNLVATARHMTVEEVDAIAGGKVWIGRQAQEIGLVDQLGSLDDAIASAAALAQVEDYDAKRFGTPITPQQLLLEGLGSSFGVALPQALGSAIAWLAPMHEPLMRMMQLKDPKHVYLQCLDCNYGY